MLIGNAFLEFGDLLYSIGRIEDGVKKGRIVSIEVRMLEKKRRVANEHVRATFVERRNKRKFNKEEEVVKSLSHSSPCTSFFSPHIFI